MSLYHCSSQWRTEKKNARRVSYKWVDWAVVFWLRCGKESSIYCHRSITVC